MPSHASHASPVRARCNRHRPSSAAHAKPSRGRSSRVPQARCTRRACPVRPRCSRDRPSSAAVANQAAALICGVAQPRCGCRAGPLRPLYNRPRLPSAADAKPDAALFSKVSQPPCRCRPRAIPTRCTADPPRSNAGAKPAGSPGFRGPAPTTHPPCRPGATTMQPRRGPQALPMQSRLAGGFPSSRSHDAAVAQAQCGPDAQPIHPAGAPVQNTPAPPLCPVRNRHPETASRPSGRLSPRIRPRCNQHSDRRHRSFCAQNPSKPISAAAVVKRRNGSI